MATTYSGDPSTSPKDEVRFLLRATGTPDWHFQDEEIEYELTKQGSVYGAAAELAVIKSTEYTDKRDKTVGPLSIKYGEIGDRWLKLAQNLRQRSGRSSGAVVVMTQKSTAPYFRLGIGDNPTANYSDPKLGGAE